VRAAELLPALRPGASTVSQPVSRKKRHALPSGGVQVVPPKTQAISQRQELKAWLGVCILRACLMRPGTTTQTRATGRR
jgi:hypothetical protein